MWWSADQSACTDTCVQVLGLFIDQNWQSLAACDAVAVDLGTQPSAAAMKAALVNRQSGRGVTPLMLACVHGHSAAVRQLVALVSHPGPCGSCAETLLA